MDIRFISTLTAEDEGQIAPAVMQAVTALLDALPIAYTLRIETLGSQVLQHTHPSASAELVSDPHPRRTGNGAPVMPLADLLRSKSSVAG